MLTRPTGFKDQAYSDNHSFDVELAHVGQGNWRAFRALGVSVLEIRDIAKDWAREFAGIDKPWLCWNVDDEWCVVQQRLVASVGWTPVVGFDPRVGPPRRVIDAAVLVDFNRQLGLPILYPHFPLEFAFLFCDRLAFWHSDFLMRGARMRAAARLFEAMPDGATAAVCCFPGWRQLLSVKRRRYWELLGCTTRGASRDQFDTGCGWWMDYWAHPNQADGQAIKAKYYWDHGSGIFYWHRRQHGKCLLKSERDLREGHFTKIGNKTYQRFREPGAMSDARRSMASEIRENFSLAQACRRLGLDSLLVG